MWLSVAKVIQSDNSYSYTVDNLLLLKYSWQSVAMVKHVIIGYYGNLCDICCYGYTVDNQLL